MASDAQMTELVEAAVSGIPPAMISQVSRAIGGSKVVNGFAKESTNGTAKDGKDSNSDSWRLLRRLRGRGHPCREFARPLSHAAYSTSLGRRLNWRHRLARTTCPRRPRSAALVVWGYLSAPRCAGSRPGSAPANWLRPMAASRTTRGTSSSHHSVCRPQTRNASSPARQTSSVIHERSRQHMKSHAALRATNILSTRYLVDLCLRRALCCCTSCLRWEWCCSQSTALSQPCRANGSSRRCWSGPT